MAFFEKNQTALGIFLNCSTFKTEQQRDDHYEAMKAEQKKALEKEERKLKALANPQKPKDTITWIGYDGKNDSKLTRNIRDLEHEIKYSERILSLGGTPNEKPKRIFGNRQPGKEIITYTNYNKIEIETIPEGITGRKWKQIKGRE